MNKYLKNIIYYSLEIIVTVVFLVVSTFIWFNKNLDIRKNYLQENILVSEDIKLSYLNQVSDLEIDSIETIKFDVTNKTNGKKEFKLIVVSDLLKDNINNNYIKYKLNDGRIKSLNSDGIICYDNLLEDETKEFSLKIWISETYSGNLNYNGEIMVA